MLATRDRDTGELRRIFPEGEVPGVKFAEDEEALEIAPKDIAELWEQTGPNPGRILVRDDGSVTAEPPGPAALVGEFAFLGLIGKYGRLKGKKPSDPITYADLADLARLASERKVAP